MRSLLNLRTLGLLAATVMLSAAQANASVIFTLQEINGYPVMTGSGTLDLTGMTQTVHTFSIDPRMGSQTFFLGNFQRNPLHATQINACRWFDFTVFTVSTIRIVN